MHFSQRAGAPRPAELATPCRRLFVAVWCACLLAAATATAAPPAPLTTETTRPSASPSTAAPSTKPSTAPSPAPTSATDADSAVSSTTATATATATTREDGETESEAEAEAVVPGEQHQVAILKQINRVNDDGSYTFGYEAADGSFKIETRDVLGHVKGMFGYIDEHGNLKRVSYSAANGTGFSQASGLPAPTETTAEAGDPLYQEVRSSAEESGFTAAATDLPAEPPTRPPVLIVPRQRLSTYASTQRAEVIQQIPRRTTTEAGPQIHFVPRKESVTSPSPLPPRRPQLVTPRPQPDGSTPTPAPYGQYIREPIMEVFVTRSNATPGAAVTSTTRRPVLVLATPIPGQPLRRLLVTRRPFDAQVVPEPSSTPEDAVDAEVATTTVQPLEGREGNDLRRQLGPDRDIDPIGLSPGVNQLYKLRQPGTADAGDVYPSGGAGAGGPLPISSAGVGGTPLLNVLAQHPRNAHNELLQKQILGDLDLRPRVRPVQDVLYPDYDYVQAGERPTGIPGRATSPPPPTSHAPPSHAPPTYPPPTYPQQTYPQQTYPQPRPSPPPANPHHGGLGSHGSQGSHGQTGPTVLPPLEPHIARALEQFLAERGIRLRINSQPAAPDPYGMDPYAPVVYQRRPYARVPYIPAPPRYRGYNPYYEDDPYDYDPYVMRPSYAYMRRVPATYLPVAPVAQAPSGYDRYERYDQPLLVPNPAYVPLMDARYPPSGLAEPVRQELLIRMLLGGRTRALVQPEIQLSDYESSVASATSPKSASTTSTTTTSQPATADRGRTTYSQRPYEASVTTPYPSRRRASTARTVVRSAPAMGARNVKIIEPETTASSERIVSSTRPPADEH